MSSLPDKPVDCSVFPAKKLNTVIDKDTIRNHTLEATVLPLYSKWAYDYVRMKKYSLKTNDRLFCEYKEHLNVLKPWKPLQLPNHDDIHFKNYNNVYAPSLSIRNQNHRRRFSDAQAYACRGNAPDCHEMHLRKTPLKPRVGSGKKPSTKLREASKTRATKDSGN